MSAKPSVSVIIPTYNRPELLPAAVSSAFAAGNNVEVIVVDDASVDETAGVCRSLNGIKYVRAERNQQVAGARNLGIVASSAPYIAFLDDDDQRLPGSLDAQLHVLAEQPQVGVVCGAMVMAGQSNEPAETIVPQKRGDVFWDLLELAFPVMPLCVVIKRECFTRVGLFNRHVAGIDDWDMFVRIAEIYPFEVTEEPVGLYRKPAPSSGQGSSMQSHQLLRALKHQKKLFRLPRVQSAPVETRRQIRKRAVNRVADTLLMSALREVPNQELRFIFANLLTAFRLNPARVVRQGFAGKWIQSMARQKGRMPVSTQRAD